MMGGRRFFSLGGYICLITLLMLTLGFTLGFSIFPQHSFTRLYEGDAGKDLLLAQMPNSATEQEDPLAVFFFDKLTSPEYVMSGSVSVFSAVALASAEPEYASLEQTEEEPDITRITDNNGGNFPEEEIDPEEKDDNKVEIEPLVAVYCTHNAEGYYGVEREAGKNSGVYQVALTIEAELEKQGVSTIVCSTIHDYPDWQLSYVNSLASMKKLKAQYPSIKVFIDVHRDAALAGTTTVLQTKTEKLAKIMLVVGSNKRLWHPNWQQNLAFSQQIGKDLESACPGILRGVRVQDGRYNQHYSIHAILVEVGSTENTLEQAKKSAAILAEVIADNMP